ncbi:TPR repeat-containing protein [Amycolatopsis vancoresmycina DSM 44592]|uniref:TPR repeat-containing protein n=1 Tax=Amycolatopsis vancoresmycina DSM 44592 TaxID=1292037 RepID=R1I0P5_9PSEU|nr:TPR repeat-containing protein [Amycolatopsis vancoresmycina DSM 44592]
MRDGLHSIMRATFAATETPWEESYREASGDAVFALVPAEADKAAFLEAALPALVTQLRVHNETHPEAQRIRLRVALNAGEVGYDMHGVTSSSLIMTFRLCDSPPLKAALAASPGVLAVIASERLFDDVVRHVPAAAPTTWHPVTVVMKEVDTRGWITLPDHPYLTDTAVLAPQGASTTGPARTNPSEVVPRQLPAAVRDFTGRAEHLTALDALLPPGPARLGGASGQATPSVVITAVDGAGGIGKTTLALHWAYRVQDRFPDGTLHINLRGYGPGTPATTAEALSGFLRALGVASSAIPTDVDAQAALLRSLTASKRLLFVLDNAHSAEQVRPLLPSAPGCMVVVTSRDSLTGLVVTDAAHRLTLDLLTPSEAHELVTGIIGADRVAAESESTSELVRLCARLPLALRIAASRIAAHSHLSVTDVVTELTDDQTRLDILSEASDERSAIRAVFDWSYRRLPAQQARLFRRLGLHPGPDMSLAAAAALAELPPADVRRMLAALTSAHLIEPAPGGRYRFHDLLRTYSVDQAHRHDPVESRNQALESMLTWYTYTAYTLDIQVHPYYSRMPAVLAEPAHPRPLTGFDAAWSWFVSERINILAALQYSADHQLDHHTVPLAHATRFLTSVGSPRDRLDATLIGVVAARRTGNPSQEAFLLLSHSDVATRLGRTVEAGADLDRAAVLIKQLNKVELEISLLNDRGLLHRLQGRFEEAARWFALALPLTKGTGRWEAVVEGNLGSAYAGLGDYRRALEHGERDLRIRRRIGDLEGESGALTHLARAWCGLGDFDKANSLCLSAISLGRGSPYHRDMTVAEPLKVLASGLHELGRTDEAIEHWEQAAAIYDETGYPHNAADVRKLLRTLA